MMQQEVHVIDTGGSFVPQEDLQQQINLLAYEGWRVVSMAVEGDKYILIVEKEAPPPVMFSMPLDTTEEEMERFRKELIHQYEHGALQNHAPLMLTGDVKVTKLSDRGIQHVVVTREMLDSWFGNSHAEEARRMDDIRYRLSKGELTIKQALDELGIDSGSYL